MNNKTPVTVLQEFLVKYQEMPSYECVAQMGPDHMSVFEYRCVARGVTARGVARSKKEAKQEAARRALAALAASGLPVPQDYRAGHEPSKDGGGEDGEAGPSGGAVKLDPRSSVALLKELCDEYRLGAVTYDLVGDTGPPHMRMFSVRAALASHERVATASTKKAARQQAADQLYHYLRENLASATRDFVEEEALSRALDKAMSRYVEMREEQPRRPDLGQRLADYHLAEEQLDAAELAAAAADDDSGAVLRQTAAALGLTVELTSLPADGGELSVVTLAPTAPALALAGVDPAAAERAALRYLRRALAHRPDRPDRFSTPAW